MKLASHVALGQSACTTDGFLNVWVLSLSWQKTVQLP